MYLARLSDTNSHAHICAAHPTIFACLFHQTCFAAALFLPHQFSFRSGILGLGSLDSGHWVRCLDIWRYFNSREAYIGNRDSKNLGPLIERGSININVIARRGVFNYRARKDHDIQRPRYSSNYYTQIGPLYVELIKVAPQDLKGNHQCYLRS